MTEENKNNPTQPLSPAESESLQKDEAAPKKKRVLRKLAGNLY